MKNYIFKENKKCKTSKARYGQITINNQIIETPVFMPVASCGTIKSLPTIEIKNFNLILVNIFHLYIRPGINTIVKLGKIKKFMGWENSILSDSGGYQIYSLKTLSNLSDDGFEIKSYLDGKKHIFTPENIIEFQRDIGVDILTILDICCSYGEDYLAVKNYVKKSNLWAKRSKKIKINDNQHLFGIIQGGIFKDLRKLSVDFLLNLSFDGYAIGGLSVGEPKELTWETLDFIIPFIPKTYPVYLMGVGTPEDIVNAVSLGVDMFDCVLPTRMGRTGTAFTSFGKIVIKHNEYKYDTSPLDEECNCKVCKNYSKGYIRHLFMADEMAGPILLSYHNIYFYGKIMEDIKNSIKNDNFSEFKTQFLKKYSRSDIK